MSTFLHLSDRDVRRTRAIEPARVVDLCVEAFTLLASGDYLMGGPRQNSHGMGLVFPAESAFPNMPTAGPDRRFVTMPAYVGGRFDVCGNKWYGSNNDNVAAGLPRSILTLMLNDKQTGAPLCLMSANALSAARTGAVPALASALLAPGARTLAVVGCGTVNEAALAAILTQQPELREVRCFDVVAARATVLAQAARRAGLAAVVATSADDCVSGADLVSVAASRTHPLHIAADAFAPTAAVLLSGPLASDDDLWLTSDLVLDHVALHEEYVREASMAPDPVAALDGQIAGPLYRLERTGALPPLGEWLDLGSLLTGRAPVPDRTRRRVLVASGMAVLDVALGWEIYAEARANGLGVPLDVWN